MPIFHEGYALKVYVTNEPKWGNTPSVIADVLGVSRQAMSGLYGQEKLLPEYVDKLKEKGIDIPGITSEITAPNVAVVNEPALAYDTNAQVLAVKLQAAEQRVKDLEELLAAKESLITECNRQISVWDSYTAVLEEKLGIERIY